jgi:hypothetical protein
MQIHGVRDDQVQRGKRKSSVPALSHRELPAWQPAAFHLKHEAKEAKRIEHRAVPT